MESQTLRYRVKIKSLARYPAVGPNGSIAHSAMFRVEPLNAGTPFDFDGGIVGGETHQRCLGLSEAGSIVVEFPATWLQTRSADWQKEIINVALEQFATDVVICFAKQIDFELHWKKLGLLKDKDGFVVLSEERIEGIEDSKKVFKHSTDVAPLENRHGSRTEAERQFGMLLNEYETSGWTTNPNGLGICPF